MKKTVPAQDDNNIGCVLDERSEPLLARSELVFRALAFSNVAGYALHRIWMSPVDYR